MKDILKKQNFVVVGDTTNHEKYAYKIKEQLLEQGYQVECVGKEKKSINEVEMDIHVLDLCIHPVKAVQLLKENKKLIEIVIVQPGAQSQEIIDFLNENHIEYIEDCLYKALINKRG